MMRRQGRPQGLIRVALREAATRLAQERGGAVWRDIARAAVIRVPDRQSVAGEREQRGVAFGPARDTIKNMVRSGELVAVGVDKPAGSTHWQEIYAPRSLSGDADPAASLEAALRAWGSPGGVNGAR